MNNCPCRNCKTRVPATKETLSCHATCSRYAEYQEGRKKEYERRRKKGILDAYETRRSCKIADKSPHPVFPNRNN